MQSLVTKCKYLLYFVHFLIEKKKFDQNYEYSMIIDLIYWKFIFL